MNDAIIQIAERLKGLREILELSQEELTKECNIPLAKYQRAENAQGDISVSMLRKVAHKYDVPLDTLLFGSEPKMNSFFLTRANKGVSVERTKAYQYMSLASGFKNRMADPFIVKVEPKDDDELALNSHKGQEFNYVLEGRLLLNINGKEFILNEGDSIYFDSIQPHGMKALDNKLVRFLAVIM